MPAGSRQTRSRFAPTPTSAPSSRTARSRRWRTSTRKGLIYSPEYGVVDFTVPHFAHFMRRRYPFDG